MMRTRFTTQLMERLLAGVLALTMLLSPWTSPVTAQTVASPQQDNSDIDCNQTPFGRVFPIGQENEVFLSVNNAHPDDKGHLNPYRLELNKDTGHLGAQFVSDLTNEPTGITALAGAAADLDGDGKTEYVEGYTDAAGQYQIKVRKNGGEPQNHTEDWPNHTSRAMAAGDLLGVRDGRQQVVIASRGGDGALNVAIFAGTANGDNVGAPVALWRATQGFRGNASMINVAVGNLNNNPYADIVVSLVESDQQTMQLIFLEYEPGFQTGAGADSALNLHERATYRFQISPPLRVKLALASLNGSSQDTVVLAWARNGGNGLSPLIILSTLRVTTVQGVPQFTDHQATSFSTSTRSFDIATGDINGDQRDEIVLGYDTSNPGQLNLVTYGWTNQPGTTPTLTELDRWQDGADGRDATNDLALAVGDLDKDTRAEVIAAFQDASPFGFQTLYLNVDQNKHLQLRDWSRQDSTIDTPPAIALGDWDNDSVRAFLSGKCARVVDGIVTGANFVPPHWQIIQAEQDKGGSIGRSVTQEQAAENSFTYSRSDTTSMYMGLSAGITTLFGEFSASAKVTGAREHATSDKVTSSVMTSTVTTVGQSWVNDALVFEPAEYNCYSYQLEVAAVPIPTDQAKLRYCEYQPLPGGGTALEASELDSWDINTSNQPEYVPIVRDWSSLALFRGAFADQSSNPSAAALALDHEIVNGSYVGGLPAQTGVQANPWWQVDLGASKAISKIRLWTPPATLSNAYVFVSDTDFRTIPGHEDPANLLNRPDVVHYSLADLNSAFTVNDTAGTVATFSTLTTTVDSTMKVQYIPITGRYVRVQRADTAALSLSEVQVFGPNHVEPDRYPLDVRDTTPNDGQFEVKLYNPDAADPATRFVWVKVRGNLLWYEPTNSLLSGMTIGRGNAIRDWSLSKALGNGMTRAQEISNSGSVGAEFEAEAGVGIRVLGGGGKEETLGLASEVVQSTSWSNEFNMGGLVQAFPKGFDGTDNDWVLDCRYRFIPYSYEVTETSNLGYQQRFPVLDYIVPDDGRASDLHRTSTLMDACRNGNLPGTTPQALNDMGTVEMNQPLTLQVLANDVGNDLTILDVGPAENGTVTNTVRTINYTPNTGFQGVDHFSYSMVSAGGAGAVAAVDSVITATVTITVGVVAPPSPTPTVTSLHIPLIQR